MTEMVNIVKLSLNGCTSCAGPSAHRRKNTSSQEVEEGEMKRSRGRDEVLLLKL